MKYISLNNPENTSNYENAVLKGMASDKGLFFPEEIVKLSPSFIKNITSLSKSQIALEAIAPYVGNEIPQDSLLEIIEHTLDFDFPLVSVENNIASLELFHGPTMAFKDVGARFMAGCLEYFIQKGNIGEVTVLVATSGDTGGAVANGFLGVKGINVVILYPKGKVSDIQERQLTTLGKNITALEVEGSFDHCQDMVKKAFHDEEIKLKRQLTSANSINVARWLPQMFYYFLAYKSLAEEGKKLAFSVPSGNFGNICAGLLAREMGLPINKFIASTNENKIVTNYLDTQKFEPGPSISTISNAMDVGNPSNFIRILRLFQNEFGTLKDNLSSYSFDDSTTKKAMKEVFESTGYTMDPHGAVGYLGIKSFLKKNPDYYGVFLETAHPVKFLKTVESAIGQKPEIPDSILGLMKKQKQKLSVKDYSELKEFLLNR